jgi:hypothetical protein
MSLRVRGGPKSKVRSLSWPIRHASLKALHAVRE